MIEDWCYEPLKDDVFECLDDLYEDGEENMLSEAQYVADEFDITLEEAQVFIAEWLKAHPQDDLTSELDA